MIAHTRIDDRAMKDGFVAGPFAWLRCLERRLDAHRWFGLGTEMAFWLFLSLLPLVAVAGLIAARLALSNWAQVAPVLGSLPAATQGLLRKELGEMVAWNDGKTQISAGIMFLWLASSGIHSIFDGIEVESDAAPRPWWRKRLLALGACLALSVGIALLALLGAGVGWLWQYLGGSTLFTVGQLESSPLGRALRLVLGMAVSVGLVSGLYALGLPPAARKSMPLLPGAGLAVGMQILVAFAYGLYLSKAGDGGAYQAGLASIGVTLIALFLVCLTLLIGIEVNHMLAERRALLLAPPH
jgi:membrane protein